MIIVRLRNGLGNQMFQYAMGRRISIRYRRELCLDTSALKKAGVIPREYGLGNFPIAARVLSGEELANAVDEQGLIAVVSQSRRGFHKMAGCSPHAAVTMYDGLWQSERHFAEVSLPIRNDFSGGENSLDQTRRELYESFRETESVCVHVRRGDYLLKGYSMRFVGLPYYNSALAAIEDQIRFPHFYIFSDDLPWCREKLPMAGRQHTFVDESGWPQFVLMSGCRHFVIANSTFSWWSAWLGSSAGKRVIAPANWFFDDEPASRDIVPDTWIRS